MGGGCYIYTSITRAAEAAAKRFRRDCNFFSRKRVIVSSLVWLAIFLNIFPESCLRCQIENLAFMAASRPSPLSPISDLNGCLR
jgi:hypothetical protein